MVSGEHLGGNVLCTNCCTAVEIDQLIVALHVSQVASVLTNEL